MTGVAPPSRVALVIGSGGVKCAAALGLQHAMQEAGIEVDMVVGCSGGSLYAAVTALGFTLEEAKAATLKLWTRDVTAQRNRRALLQLLFPRAFGFSEQWGFRTDGLILERLRTAFGERTFADARIPLHLTATDFRTGEQVVLSQGPLVPAIRASIAVPFIFAPYEVDGRLLVDGFLSDPLPVNVAMREGARVIVAMGFESPYQTAVRTPARFAFQLSSIMTNNLLKSRFAFHNAAHHAEVILVVPEFEQRVGLFDTWKIPYVIDEGRRAAERHIPYIRRLLDAGRTA
jgi:NTE family protein